MKAINLLMRWSLGTSYLTETGRVVRSLHGLASGVAGHSAITTMIYGLTLPAMQSYRASQNLDEDAFTAVEMAEYFSKFGFLFKQDTIGIYHTSDAAEFCAFFMTPWYELEAIVGHSLHYPESKGGERVVFPIHNAKRALFALLFSRVTSMDKENHRRLRCLQALLLGGYTDAGFRQSLLEVIARKDGIFSLDQVNHPAAHKDSIFHSVSLGVHLLFGSPPAAHQA